MKIEFDKILEVENDEDGSVYIEHSGTRSKLTGGAAMQFLDKYREYRMKEKNPEDRIISGVDDQADGCYSFDVEQKAIGKTMDLVEHQNHRDMTNEAVEYLTQLSEFQKISQRVREELIAGYAKLINAVRPMQPQIAGCSYSIYEIEELEEILAEIKKINDPVRIIKEKTGNILERWL